jgi:hypothetical protein
MTFLGQFLVVSYFPDKKKYSLTYIAKNQLNELV